MESRSVSKLEGAGPLSDTPILNAAIPLRANSAGRNKRSAVSEDGSCPYGNGCKEMDDAREGMAA